MISIVSSIAGIIGGVAAVAALIISIISLYMVTLKSKLYLHWVVYDTNTEYIDGNGTAEFVHDFCVTDPAEPNKQKYVVSSCRPGSEIKFKIDNAGKISAKNIVLDICFENVEFDASKLPKESGLHATSHVHGLGFYEGIRWESGLETVIHPGIPIEFKWLSFSGSKIYGNAKMKIILSSDNSKVKVFTIPIKIK